MSIEVPIYAILAGVCWLIKTVHGLDNRLTVLEDRYYTDHDKKHPLRQAP